MNFLLPPREFGEGWGGVKNLQLLQGLLYEAELEYIFGEAPDSITDYLYELCSVAE